MLPTVGAKELPKASTPLRRRRSSHGSRKRRSQRTLYAYASLLVVGGLVGIYVLYSLFRSLGARRVARSRRELVGFEESRISHVTPDLRQSSPLKLDKLLSHPLLTGQATPTCILSPLHEERYAPLSPSYGSGSQRKRRGQPLHPLDFPRHKTRYFIAINLFNSETVTPSIICALAAVTSRLGPKRFFVSVYENGSGDKTPSQLYLLGRILDQIGVGYNIVSNSNPGGNAPKDRRIAMLAELRNLVMRPLYDAPSETWDRVIFINDVHFCEADLLELMLQHETQESDQSCGMDYKFLKIKEFERQGYPLLFYDVWVARDMLGLPFYRIKFPTGEWQLPSPPLPHSPSRGLYHSLLPFQVYSCFNGISIIEASLFAHPIGLRFRTILGTDEQSECFLFCSDVWKAKSPWTTDGKVKKKNNRGARIQVVPRVSVGYAIDEYEEARKDMNTTAFEVIKETGQHDENEIIEWDKWPPKLVASYHDAEWSEEEWIPPF